VRLDVPGSNSQQRRVVAVWTQAEGAPLTEQRSDPTGLVTVIEVLGAGVGADGAPVALRMPDAVDLRLAHLTTADPAGASNRK
jgi:hypothetical protein